MASQVFPDEMEKMASLVNREKEERLVSQDSKDILDKEGEYLVLRVSLGDVGTQDLQDYQAWMVWMGQKARLAIREETATFVLMVVLALLETLALMGGMVSLAGKVSLDFLDLEARRELKETLAYQDSLVCLVDLACLVYMAEREREELLVWSMGWMTGLPENQVYVEWMGFLVSKASRENLVFLEPQVYPVYLA